MRTPLLIKRGVVDIVLKIQELLMNVALQNWTRESEISLYLIQTFKLLFIFIAYFFTFVPLKFVFFSL